MFLSQLGLNGVLSIVREQQVLTLTFKSGHLIDAQSAAGDEKVLQIMRMNSLVNSTQDAQIKQIRSETDMAVRQVLAALDLFPLENIRKTLELGLKEVLLELFLLQDGQFHFTDTQVEPDSAEIKLDTGAVAITVLSHADEFRNFEKSIQSLDRHIICRGSADQFASLPFEERVLIHLASKKRLSVRQLIALAPLYSHKAMKSIEKLIEGNTFGLAPLETDCLAPPPSSSSIDPLFGAYKQAFKTLMGTSEVLKKVEAIIGFCKNYYDGILIMTAKGQQVIHCKSFVIKSGQGIGQKTLKGDLGSIDQDIVFKAVQKSGIGFFGKIFPSEILNKAAVLPSSGECALIPVVNKAQLSLFFYAFSEKCYSGVSPHHYLELLSWLITPAARNGTSETAETDTACAEEETAGADLDLSKEEVLQRMIAKVKDLPPLPSMASKALELLSDPHSSAEEIEKAIAQDQALVAKLIKVSNSVLYGGYQKVISLRQALTRLGAKTTRSLILAASTRSYFLNGQKGMKQYGPTLWQHSVEVGVAARRIAQVAGYQDPESAFIGGIMHDIGKLVILFIDSEKYREIQRYALAERITDQAAEIEVLGESHTVVGRALMDKWRMPDLVRICTEFHHKPEKAGEHAKIAAIVAYADHLSHTLGRQPSADRALDESELQSLKQTITITPQHNDALLEAVRKDYLNTEIME